MDIDTSIETERRVAAVDEAQEQINVHDNVEDYSVSTRAEKQKNIQKARQIKIAKLKFQKEKMEAAVDALQSVYASMPDLVRKIKKEAPQNIEMKAGQKEKTIKGNASFSQQRENAYTKWQQLSLAEAQPQDKKPVRAQSPNSVNTRKNETTKSSFGGGATRKADSPNIASRNTETGRYSSPDSKNKGVFKTDQSGSGQPQSMQQEQKLEQNINANPAAQFEMVPNPAKEQARRMIECGTHQIELIGHKIEILKAEDTESKKIEEILAHQAKATRSYN